MPGIAHWPGVIRPGTVSSTVTSLFDIFTTFLTLASVDIPSDRVIDAKDLSYLFKDPNSPSAHDMLYFYCDEHLIAVRYRQYKIHIMKMPDHIAYVKRINCVSGGFPLENYMAGDCDQAVRFDEPWIFDVEKDTREEHRLDNIPDELLDEVESLIHQHQAAMVKREPILVFRNCHRKYIPCCNPPYCVCNYEIKRTTK